MREFLFLSLFMGAIMTVSVVNVANNDELPIGSTIKKSKPAR